MTHYSQFGLGGLGSNWPGSVSGDTATGREVTLIGTSVTQGSLVRVATDGTDPLLDDSKSFGPNSTAVTVQSLAGGDVDPYAVAGRFSVALQAIAANGTGRVADFGDIEARVFVPIGGMDAETPLMPDFTNGRLVLWDGTAKCIGLTSVALSDNGGAAIERTSVVHFSGTFALAGDVAAS